jgi:FkbM family methyltransferase
MGFLKKILQANLMLPLRLNGVTYLISSEDDANLKQLLSTFLPPGMYEVINDFCPQEGWKVVDVGAHHGFYAIRAARSVGNSGKVIAIEPCPKNFERLVLNVKANRLNNVICIKSLVSDSNGYGVLYIHPVSYMHSTVIPSKNFIIVKQVTLDSLLSRLGISYVDLVKIDVEGAEVKVIKGALRYLNEGRILRIVAEVHSRMLLQQYINLLESRFVLRVFPLVPSNLWIVYAKFME